VALGSDGEGHAREYAAVVELLSRERNIVEREKKRGIRKWRHSESLREARECEGEEIEWVPHDI